MIHLDTLQIHILQHTHIDARNPRHEIRFFRSQHARGPARTTEIMSYFIRSKRITLYLHISLSLLTFFSPNFLSGCMKCRRRNGGKMSYLEFLQRPLFKNNSLVRHVNKHVPVSRTNAAVALLYHCVGGVERG